MMRAMQQAWPSRDVEIVLTMEQAQAIWRRARQFDVSSGGRFDARGAACLLWSTSDSSEMGAPIGGFYVHWHAPDEQHATVIRLEWDPEQGGSQDEVWTALELLSGGVVRRS